MKTFSKIDPKDRLSPIAPAWIIEIACGVAFTAVAVVGRLLINLIEPNAAPFALVYPAALAATLVAGWRAGAIALTLTTLLAWRRVLGADADGVVSTAEFLNLVLYGAGVVVVIAVAEGFRRAHEHSRLERAARLSEHELLLKELNHRVKNNYQMVVSLLEMQRRRAGEGETSAVLQNVIDRVQSMSHAQAALYHDPTEVAAVDVKGYLHDLCDSLEHSLLLSGDVRLEVEAESCMLSRDRAVAIGMVLNELVTNAAKYAFPNGRSGAVKVTFARAGEGWRLTVADDGVGTREAKPGKGLGKRLVEAFARQAGGSISSGTGPGTTVILDLPP